MKDTATTEAWRRLAQTNDQREAERQRTMERLRLLRLATWEDEREDSDIRRKRAMRGCS